MLLFLLFSDHEQVKHQQPLRDFLGLQIQYLQDEPGLVNL